MYPSREMLISVQKYKLHSRKISPILSTQITAPLKKILQNKHIHRLCDYILQYNKIHVYNSTKYVSQYRNINFSAKIKVSVQKNIS